MRTLEFSVFIDRPQQQVFDFMTNLDNDHLWQNGLISSEWSTPEPAGVGSIKQVVTRFMGREMQATVEYTAWERPNGYAFKGGAGPFSITATTKFEAQENGTLVTSAAQVEASGIMKLMEGLVVRRAEKQDKANFNTLKELLEADYARPTAIHPTRPPATTLS